MATTDPIESFVEQMFIPEEAPVEPTESEEPAEEPVAEAPEEEVEEEVEETAEADEEPEENTEVSEQPTDRYTVSVDGEQVEVSLDDLKRGYSGQQYIQKGMKEVAESRNKVMETNQLLQQQLQQVNQLGQKLMSGQLRPPPVEPDPNLLSTDPLRYHTEKVQYDQDLAAHQESIKELQQAAEAQKQQQDHMTQLYAQEQAQMLKALDPEWGDPDRAPSKFERLQTKGSEYYGYAPEDIKGVMDHRAFLVLQDAIAYRELKETKPVVKEKVEQAKVIKKTAKPRPTSRTRKRQKQRQQLKRTGSIDDALALMFE